MAGLIPAIHGSQQLVVKIGPFRIVSQNEANLPSAGPVFHGHLAPDGGTDVRVTLYINEPGQPVPFGEPLDQSLTVLPYAPNEVGRDAEIQNPVRSIGYHVDLSLVHNPCVR